MPLAEPRSVVAARLTKPVAAACAKNVPAPTRTTPFSTAVRFDSTKSGKPMPAAARPPQIAFCIPACAPRGRQAAS